MLFQYLAILVDLISEINPLRQDAQTMQPQSLNFD